MKLRLDKIDVSSKVDEFAQYLETADRIILSAKFGDGKTYFLNELKKNKNLSEEYEFFTVYPVNYSVASNEDIFEYIKRDIIRQMYERHELNPFDIDALFDAVVTFADVASIVSFLLSFIPGGELYNKILDRFVKAKDKYKEQKHVGEEYLNKFESKIGGLYEDDGYTQLIRETIKWIKKDHGRDHKARKTVLVIEDLDRLDPQHIFRILNILSAHIDDTTEPDIVSNKFGFDNIVLVMDYETTEHIFHHFYGAKANYSGYMSKFLARAPFRYSIKELARNRLVEKIGRTLKIEGTILHMNAFLGNIAEMSLRDLMKIASFDTKERRPKDALKVNSMSFSTDLPIFSLVLLMIECGMDNDSIVNELTSSYGYDSTEYLRLIAPLCFLNEQNPSIVSFGDDIYNISTEAEGGIINAITVVPIFYHQAIPFTNYDIQTPLTKLLNGGFGEAIITSSAYKRVTEKQ